MSSHMNHMKHTSVPLKDDQSIDDFKIGDKVTITLEGVVDRLEAERTYDYSEGEKEVYPPELGVKISTVSVKGQNKFTKMSMDEESD